MGASTVEPAPTAPPRLAPLAKLPIFMALAGRRALVVGGGPGVAWKAELLAAAGAVVSVVGPEPGPDLEQLAASRPGAVLLVRRFFAAPDLAGAALAIVDGEDGDAAAVADAARRAGVPVNVIDTPALCDFQFGTVVNRSPVVVGIMTDGTAPILGQAIRRRLEAVLPAGLAAAASSAGAFRTRLKALLPDRRDRRAFWERFVDRAFGGGSDATTADALEQLALSVGGSDPARRGRVGEVAIVGAGPGDPDLLTLRAMREMQAADVIVFDRLVTPAVLELGRREARRIHVGKEGHGAACRQEDISALVVDLALAGERVVRLKGGDPAFFGRTGEEVAACRAAGVPVRIVPGITTASAAAATLTLSLTHRDRAGRVVFLTGHDRRGALPADLDPATLADPRATLVVYMARRTAADLATRLIAAGLGAETPVVALTDVSRPGEVVVRADLATLAEARLPLPDRRPVIILVGAALADATVPAPRDAVAVA